VELAGNKIQHFLAEFLFAMPVSLKKETPVLPTIKQITTVFSVRLLFCQLIITIGFLLVIGEIGRAEDRTLSLDEAIIAAQANDPWLVGNRHSQDAVESMSVSAGTLPDPKVSLGLANIPTDTFDFNQEAMTQFKVGVTQMFSRGDSLAIKRKQLETTGSQFPFQRLDRKAKIVVTVSQLWLDAYNAQESIVLIEKDRPLFEQLADVAEASYSAAVGKTRQQDIIRAQLELTRLDDRLTVLRQKQEMLMEKLSEWVSEYFSKEYNESSAVATAASWANLKLNKTSPDVMMLRESLYLSNMEIDPDKLFEYFSKHPSLSALDKKIEASKIGIDLAREKYKSQWGVNASYGYRDEDQNGKDRADFVSLGFTFDLPYFTSNRQDKQVQSSISQTEAVKTQKWALLRKMIAGFEKTKTQLNRLSERQRLYQDQLLPQMNEQAEASLTAYTNDDGDFSEVVRSRIAELNAQIDALGISVGRQKAIIELNYYFIENADDIIAKK
jgi:outer membrane protein TolC